MGSGDVGQAPSADPVQLALPEGLGTLPSEGILGSPVGPAGILLLCHLHPDPYQAMFLAKDAQEPPDVPKSPLNLHPRAGIWGHPLHVPPAPAASSKGEGTQGRQPLSGTGLRSLPRFPQAEIGREASGGGKQGWESSARLDKGAAEMGAKIFRQ